MKNTHGGKRNGARRPILEYNTKEIRRRITSLDYQVWSNEEESYDEFFDRVEKDINEAFKKIIPF